MRNVRLQFTRACNFDKRTKEERYIHIYSNEFLCSWPWVRLVSFEVSDANALHYFSCILHSHLHHIIAIITNLLSKVTYNTFFGVFTLDFLLSKT